MKIGDIRHIIQKKFDLNWDFVTPVTAARTALVYYLSSKIVSNLPKILLSPGSANALFPPIKSNRAFYCPEPISEFCVAGQRLR